jgi:hypothetical protein
MSSYHYRNIMEILVEQEVNRQMNKLPSQIAQYMRPVEIMTYALNRLTPLYACSEKGLEEQLKKAKQEHGPQIVQSVRWAIAAVQRDPLRKFTPFQQEGQDSVLQELRKLLNDETIDWTTLPKAVETALMSAAYDGAPNTKQKLDLDPEPKRSLTWQDYKRRRNLSGSEEGWSNHWASR